MIRVLIDTSAYSAFMRGHSLCKRAIQEADEIVLTPVILGELHAGFLRGKLKDKNHQELQAFLSSPCVNVVNLDESTLERYAVILHSLWQAGTLSHNDIWIDCQCDAHGLRVLTTNAHYRNVGQVIVDYLEMN